MNNTQGYQLPSKGDAIVIGARGENISATVDTVLKNGIIRAKKPDGDWIFARLSEIGQGRWDECWDDAAWTDAEFVEMRRAELQPKLGDEVHIDLITYVGCGDGNGGDWAELPLTGTILSVSAKASCKNRHRGL